jgi:replicative DNA helicase
LGGLQTGIHLLAGEPGQGKTSFVLQIAGNVSREGIPVLFVSFEESLKRLALKAVCQIAGLESKKFMDGYGEPGELKRAIMEFGEVLSGIYLIMGNSKLTITGIKSKALQMMTKRKVDKCLIIVDYLQRWASSRRDYNDFRHVVGGLVADLREVSNRLESPVLVISSQNRQGQGEANLTSLKESGDLEYSADSIMFLTKSSKRKVEEPLRAVNLVVRKNRYGDIGKVELIFKPNVGVFREGEWY